VITMGGRRSYSIEEVFGTSKKIKRDRRKISDALKEKSPTAIAGQSAKLVVDSERTIRLLAEAARAFAALITAASEEKPQNYEARKKAANRAWAKQRDARKIQTTLTEDKVVAKALARALKRRKRGK